MTPFASLIMLLLLSTGCIGLAKLAMDQDTNPAEAAGVAFFLLGGAGYCAIIFRLWQASYGGHWGF